MPFTITLQKTKNITLTIKELININNNYKPHIILKYLFILSTIIKLFISNTTTTILITPITLTTTKTIKISPYPFTIIITITTSTTFITPISSPINTLILNPKNYNFNNFIKLKIPFTIIIITIYIIIIPILFPF